MMMITPFLLIAIKIVLVHSLSSCVVNLDEDVFAEGLEQLTPNGYRFCAYNGIEYAEPPIEKNRFELPIKIPLWRGKKAFTEEGNVCMQYSFDTRKAVGSEDCLFLNIFTVLRQEGVNNETASVSFHLYANKSRNLFDKAIMMSGSMLGAYAFESNVIRCTNKLLEHLNIQNSTTVVNDLKTTDAYDIICVPPEEKLGNIFLGSLQFCFIPTFDDEFSINWPHILTQQTPMSNVPIMIGLTNLELERTMNSFETRNIEFPKNNQSITESIVDFMINFFNDDFDRIGKSLRISEPDNSFWSRIYGPDKKRFMQSFQYIAGMSYGVHKFIEQYVNVTTQESAFLYRFALNGKFGNYKRRRIFGIFQGYGTGAMHGDDLGYIFKDLLRVHGIPYVSINLTNELKTRERMVTMWTNFIKFGNPTPNTTNISWPPFNNEEKHFLNIDANITIEKLNYDDGVYELFDAIYKCLYYVECDEVNEYLHNNKSIIF